MRLHDTNDHSDSDSLSDALSPSDGYFSQRDHPRDVFADPSEDSKGRQSPPTAGSSTQRSSSPRPHGRGEERRNPSQAHSSERTPLLQSAPPTYADATSAQPAEVYEYRLPDDDYTGRYAPRSQLPFLPNNGVPQSMGRASGDEEDSAAVYAVTIPRRQRTRRLRDVCSGRRCPLLAIVLGGLAILMWLSAVVTDYSKPPDHPKSSTPEPVIGKPSNPHLHLPSHCDSLSTAETYNFEFPSLDDFSFYEALTSDDWPHSPVHAHAHFTRGDDSQSSAISVEYTLTSSASVGIKSVDFRKTPSSLTLKTIAYDQTTGSVNNCLSILATVRVRPDVAFHTLELNTWLMGITLDEDLDNEVDGDFNATLRTGGLSTKSSLESWASEDDRRAGPFRSRRTYIDVHSEMVTGRYNLYDVLSIKSHSGAISITVVPQSASKKHPSRPADFLIVSRAGSVDVREVDFDVPERDYRTSIESYSGSVDGTLLHGSKTRVAAYSGSVTLDVVPLAVNATNATTLETDTKSGYTKFTLRSPVLTSSSSLAPASYSSSSSSSRPPAPFFPPGGLPLRPSTATTITGLTSSHASRSGGMTLRYPREWEGRIFGRTNAGGITLRGREVEVVRREHGAIEARKGSRSGEKSRAEFQTASGGVDMVVGDDL